MKTFLVKRTVKHYQAAAIKAKSRQDAVDIVLGVIEGIKPKWFDSQIGDDWDVTGIADDAGMGKEFDVDENGNVDD